MQWLEQQEDEFLLNVADAYDLFVNNELKAELNIIVQIEMMTETILNFVFNTFQMLHDANGINTVKTFTVDVVNHRIIELSDVLSDEKSMMGIIGVVQDHYEQHKGAYPYVFETSLLEKLNQPEAWEWSLTKDNLLIYFDQYEVAAGAGGITLFTIPLQDVIYYINDEFVEQ